MSLFEFLSLFSWGWLEIFTGLLMLYFVLICVLGCVLINDSFKEHEKVDQENRRERQ